MWQVEMMTSSAVQCPISLEAPPSCAQITPCGHIFSYAAIMRHLQHHGGEQLRRAAPCPLCYQPLVARELRLVQVGGCWYEGGGGRWANKSEWWVIHVGHASRRGLGGGRCERLCVVCCMHCISPISLVSPLSPTTTQLLIHPPPAPPHPPTHRCARWPCRP
jgi:hypothetical protein